MNCFKNKFFIIALVILGASSVRASSTVKTDKVDASKSYIAQMTDSVKQNLTLENIRNLYINNKPAAHALGIAALASIVILYSRKKSDSAKEKDKEKEEKNSNAVVKKSKDKRNFKIAAAIGLKALAIYLYKKYNVQKGISGTQNQVNAFQAAIVVKDNGVQAPAPVVAQPLAPVTSDLIEVLNSPVVKAGIEELAVAI